MLYLSHFVLQFEDLGSKLFLDVGRHTQLRLCHHHLVAELRRLAFEEVLLGLLTLQSLLELCHLLLQLGSLLITRE